MTALKTMIIALLLGLATSAAILTKPAYADCSDSNCNAKPTPPKNGA